MAEVHPASESSSRPVAEVSSASEMSDRSIADLVKQLSEQTTMLARQEAELAKTELAVKGKQVGVGAGMFGGAGVFGLYGLGALTACVILALATAITAWLAALIVAALYGAIAGVLALSGKNKVQEGVPPVPEQMVESVKEDVEWTKQRAKEGRQ
jgi:Putative Actinobacterial Holin-X, holin superfamily III